MKLLYLAGPFSHDDPIHGTERNILAASEIALEAWKRGWAAVCPHKNTQGFQHAGIPQEVWYKGDIALMLRCDAVLMLPKYWQSKGAQLELEAAKKAGMAVYFYEEFGEVPCPYESYWNDPVDRMSTQDLLEVLWQRPGVTPFPLDDEDVVSVTPYTGVSRALVSPERPACTIFIIGAAAREPQEGMV
jgi:nucleoside 2-deoxyribosyltransferase